MVSDIYVVLLPPRVVNMLVEDVLVSRVENIPSLEGGDFLPAISETDSRERDDRVSSREYQ